MTNNTPNTVRIYKSGAFGEVRQWLVRLFVVGGVLAGAWYGTKLLLKTIGLSGTPWPWRLFSLIIKYNGTYPKVVLAAEWRAIEIAGPCLLVSAFILLSGHKRPRVRTEGLLGSARWSTVKDMRGTGLLPPFELGYFENWLRGLTSENRLSVAVLTLGAVLLLTGYVFASYAAMRVTLLAMLVMAVLWGVLWLRMRWRIRRFCAPEGVFVGGIIDSQFGWHPVGRRFFGRMRSIVGALPLGFGNIMVRVVPENLWWIGRYDRILYLRDNSNQHDLMFAPTGTGKGIGVVNPTGLTWKESVVFTDLKGELWNILAGYRTKMGSKCLRFEPSRRSEVINGQRTVARWNPLDEIRIAPKFMRETVGIPRRVPGTVARPDGTVDPRWEDDQGELILRRDANNFIVWDDDFGVSDTQNQALLISEAGGAGQGSDPFWPNSGRSLLVGLILHAIYMYQSGLSEEPASLMRVGDIISDSTRGLPDLWAEMMSGGGDERRKGYYSGSVNGMGHKAAASAGQDMNTYDPKLQSNIIATVKAWLTLYRDPVVGANSSYSDFRVSDLMHHDSPVSLFLVIPPADKERLMPYMRLLLDTLTRRLTKDGVPIGGGQPKYKHRLLCLLDEFPSFGKLTIVQEMLAYARGYGIKFYLISQDLDQLRDRDRYGQNETITGNCNIQVAYAPAGVNYTAEYLSKRCGEQTITFERDSASEQRGGGSRSWSMAEHKRPLLDPSEVAKLPGFEVERDKREPTKTRIVGPGKILTMVSGMPAVYGTQMPFFLDDELLARSLIPPPRFTAVTTNATRGAGESMGTPQEVDEPPEDEQAFQQRLDELDVEEDAAETPEQRRAVREKRKALLREHAAKGAGAASGGGGMVGGIATEKRQVAAAGAAEGDGGRDRRPDWMAELKRLQADYADAMGRGDRSVAEKIRVRITTLQRKVRDLEKAAVAMEPEP